MIVMGWRWDVMGVQMCPVIQTSQEEKLWDGTAPLDWQKLVAPNMETFSGWDFSHFFSSWPWVTFNVLFYLANRIFVFSVNRGSTEFDCTGSLSIRTSSHPFVAKGGRRIFVSQPRRLLSWSSTYSDVFHVAHPGSSNLRRSKPKPSETQVNMVSKLVRCM